jgi:hypothetical protein
MVPEGSDALEVLLLRSSRAGRRVRLALVPVTLTEAKRLVNEHHEHNETTARQTWKFGTGIACDGELVGVAMVGRPTAPQLNQFLDVEITRVCITEKGVYKNAASQLYGAACRMAAAGGYRAAYTYTLESEDAASVRAAGFVFDADVPASETWSRPSRPRQDETLLGPRRRPTGAKKRWKRVLSVAREGLGREAE